MSPITKLLIANRGEIACRVARSASALGIATVAVASDPDRDALHARIADEVVHLAGSAAADTYLRHDLLLDAARRTGADAVHPGYGFLSEQADFAQGCLDAELVWVGPPPHAIAAMGSKTEAKRLMAEAGVPVLPSASPDDLPAAVAEVGFPMLVKAVFGGGGRGMRLVRDEGELADAVTAAQREAAAAFGDGTVFIERFVERPRHVEVQVLADAFGDVVHLFERECSIQRRHQKVIEESPSPAISPAQRDEIGQAAVAAAKAIGYVNAGTVEFVLDPSGAFSFLEVNTRLQVEHPVTEMVTGLDLVALQLRIAQGEPLPSEVHDAEIRGHAIEARLYAEDVRAGYLPTSGRVERLRFAEADDIRVDTGYDDGSVVSTFYDAMLAKVIAWAPTRDVAARRLADALARAEIHGVVTNRDLLVGVLRHPEFLAGRTDTGFLDRHDPAALAPAATEDTVRRHAIAALLADRDAQRGTGPLPAGIPAGWRNVGPASQPTTFVCGDVSVTVDLDDLAAASADPHVLRCSVHRVGDVVHVDSVLGSTALRELARFPVPEDDGVAGSLRAPMPGAVTRVAVEVGQVVALGEVLVTLEAMKMEHALRAPHAGAVTEVRVTAGDQVETGDVLVVVEAVE
jgi:propionyl-CoA carboxylase alpha chain